MCTGRKGQRGGSRGTGSRPTGCQVQGPWEQSVTEPKASLPTEQRCWLLSCLQSEGDPGCSKGLGPVMSQWRGRAGPRDPSGMNEGVGEMEGGREETQRQALPVRG